MSDALRVARGMVDADGLVVVAGSLYVVGAARADVFAAACRGRTPATGGGCGGLGPVLRRLCSVQPSWTAPLSS